MPDVNVKKLINKYSPWIQVDKEALQAEVDKQVGQSENYALYPENHSSQL